MRKEDGEMDGGELLKLLDFVKDLQKRAEDVEEDLKQADDEKGMIECRSKAEIYRGVAERLESLLRKLNP